MPKKLVKKKAIRSKKSLSNYKVVGISIIIVGCLLLFVVAIAGYNYAQQNQVLGSSTFLAQGGDDSGESSGGTFGGSDASGSGSSGSSGSSTNTSDNTNTSGSISGTNSGSNESSGVSSGGFSGEPSDKNVSGGAIVNCTGPDGKVFVTSASNCENLNKQWHHAVTFTVINQPKVHFTTSEVKPTPEISEKEQPKIENPETEDTNSSSEAELQAETDDSTKVNLKENGTQLEIKQNNGKLEIKAKKSDGTEVELKTKTLDDVNSSLEAEDGPQIEASGAGTFIIKRNGVEAETSFPLSLDVNTKQLTVTTPSGTKEVAVLPDQAIINLFSDGKITATDPTTSSPQIQLTETNNQPVFEVQGVSTQKLLGVIPDTIHKTVDVSVQTGQVVNEKESFLQSLLDLLSF